MKELQTALKQTIKDSFGMDIEPEMTRPEEQFGDYSTNVAMQLAPQLGQAPIEIARAIIAKLPETGLLESAKVAPPGFINLRLSEQTLSNAVLTAHELPQPNQGKEILVEFGDPNPFKELHIGHLYSAVAGDAIAGLLEASGATVRRISYHGDVGLHVARAIWAMKRAGGELEDDLGKYYAQGAKAYEEDKQAAAEIREINKHIYARDDPEIARLHDEGIERSFRYFDRIFNELGIKYEPNGRYLESAATDVGAKLVSENIGKVFEKSEGAIVYKGEKVGLHTRVFINSEGLPTYEAKDFGLVELKDKDYPKADRSIIITAHEQSEYFKVMLAALAEINPQLATKTTHLYHGFVTLSTGKMSSRTGDVFAATELLNNIRAEVKKRYPDSKNTNETYLGAVKYAFLMHRLGPDIVFDVEESVSLEGNSGPYLQYAYARARSVLQKAGDSYSQHQAGPMQAAERSLARKISQYPEIVAQATAEYMPSHVTTYLYELAQNFNRFYESNRVVGDERQNLRVGLTLAYAQVLKSGLSLLNIPAPERM